MKKLLKILEGDASEGEKKEFFESLDKEGEVRSEAEAMAFIHQLSRKKNISYKEKEEGFKSFWKSTRSSITVKSFFKYAAIVVVALSIGSVLTWITKPISTNVEQKFSYTSQMGSISNIVLPDSSVVWLNSDSKLDVLLRNGQVYAYLEGEAYFDIKHDDKREFIVDLGTMKVKDLGTKFNIRHYPQDVLTRATLIEGEIEVLDNKDASIRKIVPGQAFMYHKSKSKYWVKDVDTELETAWTNGQFVFVDRRLEFICKELEKWYEVDFIITDEALALTKYSCVLRRSTTVEQVLRLLELSSGIKYEVIHQKGGIDKVLIKQ